MSSDEFSELAKQALDGDLQSYQILLKKTYEELLPFVSRKIYEEKDRDDVLQEILISIHKSLSNFETSRSYLPWVYTIANFRIVDYIRSKKKESQRVTFEESLENVAMETVEEDEEELSKEISKKLDELLQILSPIQKKVIELVKIHKLSVKNAASVLGLSESNVKIITHRALAKIRQNEGKKKK